MSSEAFYRKVRDALEVLFLLFFLGLLFVYVWRPNWEIDIFWHIRTGDWIVSHRALPHTDIFSATDPTRPWTPFQWLYEVLVYEIEAYFGFRAIRMLHAGLFMLAFLFLYKAFRRLGTGRVVAMFLLVLSLALSEDRLRVRPEAFNFFFGALLLPVLLRERLVAPSRRTIAFVALVAAAWANIHAGGALLMPLSFGALFVGRAMALDWRAARADLLAAATLPMLPMPGFLSGAVTAFSMLEESAVLIPEWHPPLAYFWPEMAGRLSAHHVLCGLMPYVILLLCGGVIVVGVARFGWRAFVGSRDPGLLLLAFAYAALGAKSARFIYLDTIALAALICAYRAELAHHLAPLPRRVALLVLLLGLLGISYENSILRQRKGLYAALASMDKDIEPGLFPELASDAVSAMGLRGRIFHTASWGGYLIWRHYPDCTVFTDSRGNFTREEREVMVETHKPFERYETIERAWQKFPFEILIMPPPVFPLLDWDRSRWVFIWRDNTAEVFLRLSPENEENITKALNYWKRMGIDAGDDLDAFQDELLRVLSWETLSRPEVKTKLDEAAQKAFSKDKRLEPVGAMEGGLILFQVGRYVEAERQFRRVLRTIPRHSTAALYLAWSRYLLRDYEGARAALQEHFLDQGRAGLRDQGPLRWAGERILALLLARLRPAAPPGATSPP